MLIFFFESLRFLILAVETDGFDRVKNEFDRPALGFKFDICFCQYFQRVLDLLPALGMTVILQLLLKAIERKGNAGFAIQKYTAAVRHQLS